TRAPSMPSERRPGRRFSSHGIVDSRRRRSTREGHSRPELTQETDVEYLLLIYANEAGIEAMDKAEMSTIMEDFGAFTDPIVKAGNYKGSNRLRPVSAATTVRRAA